MSESPHPHPQNPLVPVEAARLPADEPSDLPLVPVRPRLDGWTAERQRAFIEHLADHGCVKSACAHVGMSEQSAYALRRRPDAAAFEAAWIAALERTIDRVVETAVDSAINGTARGRYWKGERVGEEHVHSDRLLIWLIEKGRIALAQARKRGAETRAVIADNIDALEDVAEIAGRVHVWLNEFGHPRTNAPPPPGLGREQRIELGQKGIAGKAGYSRYLTVDEREAWKALTGRGGEQAVFEEARRVLFGLDDAA